MIAEQFSSEPSTKPDRITMYTAKVKARTNYPTMLAIATQAETITLSDTRG